MTNGTGASALTITPPCYNDLYAAGGVQSLNTKPTSGMAETEVDKALNFIDSDTPKKY